MPYLKLCREKRSGSGKSELEGIPIALVMSSDPELVGQFLCYIPDASDVTDTVKEAAKQALVVHKTERTMHVTKQTKTKSRMEALRDAILRGDESIPAHEDAEKAEDKYVKKREREAWEAAGSTAFREILAEASARSPANFIELPPGSYFEPLPTFRPSDPDCIKSKYRTSAYIAAPAEAGKSVYASGIIARYHKMWPRNPIYGICATKLSDDETYKSLPIKQIPLEFIMKAYEKKQGLKELFGTTGCLLLCDDWDSMESTRERPAVLRLIQDVLNLGRKMLISLLVTSHLLNNYMQTKPIINDSEYITVFPEHTIQNQIRLLLGKVISLDETTINRVFSLGRWVTLHKTFPQYLLSQKQCSLLLSNPAHGTRDILVKVPRAKQWKQGPYEWAWKGSAVDKTEEDDVK